jgi:hypothetical protein
LGFDEQSLLKDLSTCERLFWANHYNTNDYSGSWKGIALRSASGSTENILALEATEYKNTPLLGECPYFRSIVEGFECALETVRLLSLEPGSLIKTHRDRGLSYAMGCFRLHIPILSEPAVEFAVDGENVQMKAGECWYANFDLPHSVRHLGEKRRVHLVIDGKRNEWTDNLFKAAGYDFSVDNNPMRYDEKTRIQMIEQFEAMGTETALRLVAELKKQARV